LAGDNAVGDWVLEVTDSRGGATGGQLMKWDLFLTYSPVVKEAVALTNCEPYTNIVSGANIKYFTYDSPRSSTQVTNTLIGTGDLVLAGDRDGAPDGDVLTDNYYVDQRG